MRIRNPKGQTEAADSVAVLDREETRRLLIHPVLQREAAARPESRSGNSAPPSSRFHTPFKPSSTNGGWKANMPL